MSSDFATGWGDCLDALFGVFGELYQHTPAGGVARDVELVIELDQELVGEHGEILERRTLATIRTTDPTGLATGDVVTDGVTTWTVDRALDPSSRPAGVAVWALR